MKHIALLVAAGLTLAAAPARAPAQTRISVAVGVGVPSPYVSGFVVVGRPHFYRPPLLVVVRPVRRPWAVRPLFVDRVMIRGRAYGHYHHRHRYHYDDDE